MRLNIVFALLSIIGLACCWDNTDREIFALQADVEKDLGKGFTLYDWFNVEQNADEKAIYKAYRKLSKILHPDKNPSRKAHEKYARLNLANQVLMKKSARERYDFFLSHGFPKWKGTDYYYSRFRPGIVSVLVFLYLLVGVFQYFAAKITYGSHVKHMESVIAEARDLAWSGGFPSSKRKVTLPNGKLFMVYPSKEVALIDNGTEYPLRKEDIAVPSWHDTILFKLPAYLYAKITGNSPEIGHRLGGNEGEEVSTKKKSPKPAVKVGNVRRRK